MVDYGTLDQRRWRDEYEFDDQLAFVGVASRCLRCGGEIEDWGESIYCCGPEYSCRDTLYCFACHNCKVMGDRF